MAHYVSSGMLLNHCLTCFYLLGQMALCSFCHSHWNAVIWCVYKLKQKHQQHKTNIADTAEANQTHSECHRSKDAVSRVSTTTSFRLTENNKRKSSSDLRHDNDVPGKRLKFSSLFTNNPAIPHVNRFLVDSLHCIV